MSIILTDKALSEIKKDMEEQNISTDENVLDVGVNGGGCSGFQYCLGFKKKSDTDPLNETTYKFEGLEAVIGNSSLPLIEGTTIDFHQGLEKRGFIFNNPNSKGGCGCGNSFKA